jgi:hypothetical protein
MYLIVFLASQLNFRLWLVLSIGACTLFILHSTKKKMQKNAKKLFRHSPPSELQNTPRIAKKVFFLLLDCRQKSGLAGCHWAAVCWIGGPLTSSRFIAQTPYSTLGSGLNNRNYVQNGL